MIAPVYLNIFNISQLIQILNLKSKFISQSEKSFQRTHHYNILYSKEFDLRRLFQKKIFSRNRFKVFVDCG